MRFGISGSGFWYVISLTGHSFRLVVYKQCEVENPPPASSRAHVLPASQATPHAVPGAGGAAVPSTEQASGRTAAAAHWQWSAAHPAPPSRCKETTDTHTRPPVSIALSPFIL